MFYYLACNARWLFINFYIFCMMAGNLDLGKFGPGNFGLK